MRQADFYDTPKCEKHKIKQQGDEKNEREKKKIKINFGIDIFSYVHIRLNGDDGGIRREGEKAIWK
jgi:hypothetical protein